MGKKKEEGKRRISGGREEKRREREERKNREIGKEESLCFPGRCGDFGSVFQEMERGEQMLSEAKKI